MASTARPKAADRQAILKKLVPLLKKQYKVTVPKLDRPVMETMLYAVCLENASVEEAERAYQRIFELFPDLNELRVSSILELEPIFEGMDDPDWRAFRARSVLQYIFEKSFNFEFESLRKKTLELATKQLAKIKHLSPFIRTFTLQQAVGAHLLPFDDASARVLVWLGLSTPDQSVDDVGESLKAVVRKADAQQFCFAVRCLATDKKFNAAFDPKAHPAPEGGHDGHTAMDRLADLIKNGGPVKAKPKPAEPAPKSAAPVKSAPKAAPKKSAGTVKPVSATKKDKPTAKPTATKKPANKK